MQIPHRASGKQGSCLLLSYKLLISEENDSNADSHKFCSDGACLKLLGN